MEDMENINSSTVMKRLLAEYKNDAGAATPTTHGGSRLLDVLRSSTRAAPSQHRAVESNVRDNQARSGSGDRRSDNVGPVVSTENETAARLDALCRSTLLHPAQNQSRDIDVLAAPSENSPQTPHVAPSGSRQNGDFLMRPRPGTQQGRDLLNGQEQATPLMSSGARRPPPSYAEAQVDMAQTSATEGLDRGYNSTARTVMSPRHHKLSGPATSLDDKQVGVNSFRAADPARKSTGALKASLQFNGHPKSNSGGEEYLYTDSARATDINNKRLNVRGLRGKKNAQVTRSRSLHQSHGSRANPTIVQHSQRLSIEDQRLTRDQSSSSQSSANVSRSDSQSSDRSRRTPKALTAGESPVKGPQPRHFTSVSAPSQSSHKSPPSEHRRYSTQVASTHSHHTRPSDEAVMLEPPSVYHQAQTKESSDFVDQSSGLHAVMPQTPTASSGSYLRTPTQVGLHYYSPVTTHPMQGMVAAVTTPTHPSLMSNHSPPRRPPPPYPMGIMNLDQTVLPSPDRSESSAWQPQRPNSLALGQAGKKKGRGSAVNSPTVTSPTCVANSFAGTPIRGTPFYSAAKESPYMTPSFQQQQQQSYQGNGVSLQRQTNAGASGQFLRRSNSGRMLPTSSSSSSSTATAVSTPNYTEMPPFADGVHRSPAAQCANTYSTSACVYTPDVFSNTTNVSKSDSMNSGTSSGSANGARGIARRRKRNTSSRGSYPTNTSGSGSSSNSGSRPNSTVDLADSLEVENENLRNQLQATLHKLKRFETLETELQRLSEEHRSLHQSASKREALENEMRSQLSGKAKRLEKEKQALKGQVTDLAERLQAVDLSSAKDNDTDDRNILQLYEATTRKFAEKERQLQDELDECRERLAEQSGEINHLTTSLETAETTITCLKEKFLQTSAVDSFTEKLPERLAALHRIVAERQTVETKLRDQLKRQLVQRPLKSTSSNDEGISEMDSLDASMNGTNSALDLHSSRDSQMLGVKAEMLKWQHKYLEQELAQDTQAHSDNKARHPKIYNALRIHRHAISDPGFDKNSLTQCLNSAPSGTSCSSQSSTKQEPNPSAHAEESSSSADGAKPRNTNRDSGCCGDVVTGAAASGIDCACQTPDGEWLLSVGTESVNGAKTNAPSAGVASPCAARATANGARATHAGIETDSPSEGYHSQQSSGSPTPNTEKSVVHFPAGVDAVSTTCTPGRDNRLHTIRRNCSADALTSMRD